MPSLALSILSLAAPEPWAPAGPNPGPEVEVAPTDPPAQLHRTFDGFRAVDPDPDAGFSALIQPDGTVVFRDRPRRPRLGRQIDRTAQRDRDRLDPITRDRYLAEVAPLLECAGSVNPIDRQRRYAKAKFLRDTAPLRERMAQAQRNRALKRALARLGNTLARVWRDPTLSMAQRKAVLFRMWDEAAEPGRYADRPGPEASAGKQARARILRFIRQQAPTGTDRGFTDAELRAMNARRHSRGRFDPYPRSDPPRGGKPNAPPPVRSRP